MAKTILITGASGFVGSHLAREAQRAGYSVRGLVRATSNLSLLPLTSEHIIQGDITDIEALRRATQGVDAVVHCAATTSEMRSSWEQSHRTNVEGTVCLIAECVAGDIHDFIHISSQSAKPENPGIYGRTKLESEQLVMNSKLQYRILRPNVIYGPGSKGLFAKMTRFIRQWPVIPVIGSGRQKLRPLYVGDLTKAIMRCLDSPETKRRRYDLGGKDAVTFNEFLDQISRTQNLHRYLIHLPIPFCIMMARALQLFLPNPPMTVDNIHGIRRMKPSTNDDAIRDFNFQPRKLAEGLRLTFERSSKS